MTEPPRLTQRELEQARDLGAAAYINAYIRLMTERIGVPINKQEDIAAASNMFVPVMNFAMTFAWCLFVRDRRMAEEQLKNLQIMLDREIPK